VAAPLTTVLVWWLSMGRTVDRLRRWPVLRQLREPEDRLGLGRSVRSQESDQARPRTETADRVVKSICPYCGVGCGQRVFVKDDRVIQIEGDPDSPISRGRLCPKGSASLNLVTSKLRQHRCLYRRPFGTKWESISLDEAMDKIAERLIRTRAESWEVKDEDGNLLNRTRAIANLGGATLDIEENYLIKKLCIALGIVQVSNQARI
jgi:formate dehydrogenase major subunit